ncbi:hypothetical protein BDV96DRAFT_332212 [Lophiotrema nucula]|uniref:Uncharacterized protein n=1 Tax=Lophiotrema nucula TaxID=690887 RepID=A0A6A5YHG3_9PLEO|nr:hypothetical protein BDV96DRAFT_332212 [Lophiotrema nucula]
MRPETHSDTQGSPCLGLRRSDNLWAAGPGDLPRCYYWKRSMRLHIAGLCIRRDTAKRSRCRCSEFRGMPESECAVRRIYADNCCRRVPIARSSSSIHYHITLLSQGSSFGDEIGGAKRVEDFGIERVAVASPKSETPRVSPEHSPATRALFSNRRWTSVQCMPQSHVYGVGQ